MKFKIRIFRTIYFDLDINSVQSLFDKIMMNKQTLHEFMREKTQEGYEGGEMQIKKSYHFRLYKIDVCLAIPPKYSVSTIVGYLKGKSAMIVFEKYSRLKRNFRGHSFWARGYYVSTVGLDEAKIRKYIKNQETNESIEDKYDDDLSDPFQGSLYQVLIRNRLN